MSFGQDDWPVHIAAGCSRLFDEETLFDPTLGDVTLTGVTFELDAGVRKIWKKGKVLPTSGVASASSARPWNSTMASSPWTRTTPRSGSGGGPACSSARRSLQHRPGSALQHGGCRSRLRRGILGPGRERRRLQLRHARGIRLVALAQPALSRSAARSPSALSDSRRTSRGTNDGASERAAPDLRPRRAQRPGPQARTCNSAQPVHSTSSPK